VSAVPFDAERAFRVWGEIAIAPMILSRSELMVAGQTATGFELDMSKIIS
jgi:hypothetical protein